MGSRCEDYLSGKVQILDFVHLDDKKIAMENFHNKLKGQTFSDYVFRISLSLYHTYRLVILLFVSSWETVLCSEKSPYTR